MTGSCRDRRRPRAATGAGLLLAGLALAVPSALVGPSAAGATGDGQPEGAEELGVTVVVGHGGRTGAPGWTPVEVRLSPRRPVAGTLVVSSGARVGGEVATELPLEVAAGTTRAVRTVLPDGAVSVTVREDERDDVTVRPPAPEPAGGYLVGVLGEAPSEPPAVRVPSTGLAGAWVDVDPAWLDQGPAALAPLGTVVTTATELGALASPAARSLGVAAALGADVVVVADGDGPVGLDPLGLDVGTVTATGGEPPARTVAAERPAWPLDLDGRTVAVAMPVGRGRLIVTGVAPGGQGAGSDPAVWSELATPGRGVLSPPEGFGLGSDPFSLAGLLADPDAPSPAVPWLSAYLLAYVAVVGPVNGLVLGRFRRRELAWVTVPAVTAVFTVAALVGTVGARPAVGVSGTVTAWADDASVETAVAVVRSPTAATRSLGLPGAGWSVEPAAASREGGRVTTGVDTTVALALDGLAVGGLVARRVGDGEAPLTVDARAGAAGVEVTVANRTEAPLAGVVLRVDGASRMVGDLAPGEERTEVVTGAEPRTLDPFDGAPFGPGNGRPGMPGGLEAALQPELIDSSPGLVWAVATAPGAAGPAAAVGDDVTDRGGLVAVAARPGQVDGEPVSPRAVARDLVGVSGQAFRPTPWSVQEASEAFVRFRVPPGSTLDRVFARLPADAETAVWDRAASAWVPTGEALPADGGDPARLLSPLGEVYVRASGGPLFLDLSGWGLGGLPAGDGG